MLMSPAELRFEKPGRSLLGYRRGDVDEVIASAATAYEKVWRARAELEDRAHELELEVARHREVEDALRHALVSAEKAADELRSKANKEAELIVREAEARARQIVHESYGERERVRREIERLREQERGFRGRIRALVGSTLQAVRDHEEWLHEQGLAGHEGGAEEPAEIVRAG